jgi:uncharacterized protein YoaH (UPF0181 family)
MGKQLRVFEAIREVESRGVSAQTAIALVASQLGMPQETVGRIWRRFRERGREEAQAKQFPHRFDMIIKNGTVLVGGDAHRWPGPLTTAQRGFVKLAKTLQPKATVLNGDIFDGSRISRHPPIGWETTPSVIEELEACQDFTGAVEKAAPDARKPWALGNHDARFETRLAMVAPEYARVYGVHLRDHFPAWVPCWSVWINNDVVIKHRFKGGVHATHNNALWAGKNMITNHDHMLKITPVADYNGLRWGCSSGTLADPYGPQFTDYTEDAPKNWEAGFLVLTFKDGQLLWPEPVYVLDEGRIAFRGEVLKV